MSTYTPIEQRMDALARANEIRLDRAQLKRSLKSLGRGRAGLDALADLIERKPSSLLTSQIGDLMMWPMGMGRAKVTRYLRQVGLSYQRALDDLTLEQRRALARALRA